MTGKPITPGMRELLDTAQGGAITAPRQGRAWCEQGRAATIRAMARRGLVVKQCGIWRVTEAGRREAATC